MASTVAGHKRAFGTDTVPGTYEDLEGAELIVLVGSNLAWCHPVLCQRVLAALQAWGTRIIAVDLRRTASCDGTDLHLKLRFGSDVVLFYHLFVKIYESGLVDTDSLANTHGCDEKPERACVSELSVTGLDPLGVA